ncbi:hypothetical protein MKY28_24100 [Paenibacillus sp. FSL R5-0473]|uniref:hypothetical protein n=1 Tax=Paenibacillus sp. FSL R5-0473 TaxID=2921642 RepID=UPI0030FC1865
MQQLRERCTRLGHSIDLAAFGRPFIANPDLVQRLHAGQQLVEYNANAHLPVLV